MSMCIFDGHDLGELFTVGNPEIRFLSSNVVSEQVPGRDGAVITGRTWGTGEASFSLLAKGDWRERRDAFSQLGMWLSVDEPKPLYIGDERYHMAIPTGELKSDIGAMSGTVRVTFMLDGPAYGPTRTVTIPSGGSVTFDVGGTAATRPTIATERAYRDASSLVWGVRLDEGDYLHVLTGSSSYRSVSLDCDARTCIVNSHVSLPTVDSDWFSLAPGTHTVRMDNGTGAATLTYVERWL